VTWNVFISGSPLTSQSRRLETPDFKKDAYFLYHQGSELPQRLDLSQGLARFQASGLGKSMDFLIGKLPGHAALRT
jgi:hypothetical protein